MDSAAAPILQLRAADYPGTSPITSTITLEIGEERVPALLTASLGEAPYEAQLPIFRAISDELTARGIAREAAAGRTLSCRAGCGVCCRQAVPVSPSEGRAVAAHVAAMPEPLQSAVRARFAAARQALAEKGVEDITGTFSTATTEARLAFGMDYLRAGVACPFLVDENCSIHPVRPLVCREYLVTSPAENCRRPTMDNVSPVRHDGSLSQALLGAEAVLDGQGRVLLVDALVFADANPAGPPVHNGPTLVKAMFDLLAKLSG